MPTLTIGLEPDQAAQFLALAEHMGKTPSQLFEYAIDRYLERLEQDEKRLGAEAVRRQILAAARRPPVPDAEARGDGG